MIKSLYLATALGLLLASPGLAFKFKDDGEVDESATFFGEEESAEPGAAAVREERKIESALTSNQPQISPEVGNVETTLKGEEEATAEEENVQGRFFDIKGKLCALGLSDCNDRTFRTGHRGNHQHQSGNVNHGQIQYVQPVKLVAHGAPIAAVPLGNNYQPPASSNIGSYNSPSAGYAPPKPHYGPPKRPSSGYGAPSYEAPKPSYKTPSYEAPKPSYDAPSYEAPKPVYNAPSYEAPAPSYNAPSYKAPKPSYKAPTYEAPKPSYHATPSYKAPKPSYGAPSSYDAPTGPLDSYSSPKYDLLTPDGNRRDNHHQYQTNFDDILTPENPRNSRESGHHGHHGGHHNSIGGHHHKTGSSESHRQGRKDDCYCVPVAQCPSFSVVTDSGKPVKDYSDLINPRVLPGSEIVAGDAAGEDADTLDLSAGPGTVENNRARSLELARSLDLGEEVKEKKRSRSLNLDAVVEVVDVDTEAAVAVGKTGKLALGDGNDAIKLTRRSRRDAPLGEADKAGEVAAEAEEEQFPDAQGRQFGPSGFRPPTCGGPGSGYVCCKLGAGQNGFTTFVSAQNKHESHPHGHDSHHHGSSHGSSHGSTSHFSNQENNQFSAGQNRPVRQEVGRFNQCGKKNSQGINGRIAGNTFIDGDAEFAEYPWQVAILKKEQFDNVYVCGGSLVDGSHILTAAHCVKSYRPEDLRIRLGEWDVNNDSEFYTHVEFDAKDIFLHKNFAGGNLYNDIAMIRLNGYVDYAKNPHVSPVCLPDRSQEFDGQRCYVTGWGKDSFKGGAYQQVLKEVDVPIIGNQRCERLLQNTKLGYDFTLHDGFLCAGGEEGKDACKGDGGGPLVCEDRQGLWQLAGIVSWGVGCGERDVPGVYVKVSQYQDWIQQQLLRPTN